MSDGSGSASWCYDAGGRIVAEQRTILGTPNVTKTIQYAYNEDGTIASITYPSGRTITYTTGNAERATAATDVANNLQYAATASYAPIGALNTVIYGTVGSGSAITATSQYNNRLGVNSISAATSSATVQSFSFSYNLPTGNNGEVSSITNNVTPGLGESFTYDSLNRILSAATSSSSASGCWGESFGPSGAPPPGPPDDRWSNLTQINLTQCSGGILSVIASTTTNQITTTGYQYDAAGNMTQEAGTVGYSYTFNAENRLINASGMSGGPWSYVYDGNGLRVKKSNSAGGTLYWRSITGDTIAETDLNGNVTSEYVFFAGRRIGRRDASNNVYFYYTDQVGSTTSITAGNGAACYIATFAPYGEEHYTQNNCPQNYKFTGYERDSETGLDYAFARYYDFRLGRFLSPDPVGGSLDDPQSLNRYAYVGNNPLAMIDPSGLNAASSDCIWNGDCLGLFGPGGGGGGYYGGLSTPCTLDWVSVSCSSIGGLGGNGMGLGANGISQVITLNNGVILVQDASGEWINASAGEELSAESVGEIGSLNLGDPFDSYPFSTSTGQSGSGGSPQKLKDKNGVPCDQKILGRFNAQFGTNAPLSNTTDLGPLGHGGVTDNINIYFPLASLPSGLIQPGRFGGGPLGTGSTLHVVNFYVGLNPQNQLSDIAQVHLDQGNPFIPPLGTLSHLDYFLTHSGGPCP